MGRYRSYNWISTDGRREYTREADGAWVRLIEDFGPEGGRIRYWDGYIGKRRINMAATSGKNAKNHMDRFYAPGDYDEDYFNTPPSPFSTY